MASSAVGQSKAFLCGQQLAPAPRTARTAQPAQVQIQSAAAATKRLKAGASKNKTAPRKPSPPKKGGTQRLGGSGTQLFGGNGTIRIGSQPVKKVNFYKRVARR